VFTSEAYATALKFTPHPADERPLFYEATG